MLATRVEIPSAWWTPILIAKLSLLACILLVAAFAVPFVHMRTIKVLVVVIPFGLFLRYHTKKDPWFLQKLFGQISFKRYYFHG